MAVKNSDDERPSTIQEELTLTEGTDPNMRTPQTEEKTDLPTGSEHVVNVRRVPRTSTTPLTVNTQMTVPETVLRHEKMHHKHRSEHRHSSLGHHGSSSRKPWRHGVRSAKAWSTELPSDNREQRKVLSCLEMNFEPAQTESSHTIPEQSNGEHSSPVRLRKSTRPPKKSRSSELGSWLSPKSENPDQSKWRYSHIFAPESPKLRPRKHRHHKSRTVPVQHSPGSQLWSPYIPIPVGYYPPIPYVPCPRCGPESPTRAYSYETFGPQQYVPYPVPYPAHSSENCYTPRPYWPHYHHHCPPRMSMPRSRTMPPPHGGRLASQTTVLSTSADDLGYPENEEYERTIMEIEYAVADDEDTNTRMTPKTLQYIVKLARQICKLDDLEEMAKQMKLSLDKKFGEKWQVVIGDDSFGSYLASLPGALANFRINDFVFLVWQT